MIWEVLRFRVIAYGAADGARYPPRITQEEGMKIVIAILLMCLTGCSGLILRDDDTAAQTTGKVVTRSLLIVPTLFWSEAFIAKAKREEAFAKQWNEASVYFAAKCEAEGYPKGSAEHPGCVSTKLNAAMPQQQTVVMPMPMPMQQQRFSTTCYSSGAYTRCY